MAALRACAFNDYSTMRELIIFYDRLILSHSVLLTYITELQEEDSLRSSVRDVYDQN